MYMYICTVLNTKRVELAHFYSLAHVYTACIGHKLHIKTICADPSHNSDIMSMGEYTPLTILVEMASSHY